MLNDFIPAQRPQATASKLCRAPVGIFLLCAALALGILAAACTDPAATPLFPSPEIALTLPPTRTAPDSKSATASTATPTLSAAPGAPTPHTTAPAPTVPPTVAATPAVRDRSPTPTPAPTAAPVAPASGATPLQSFLVQPEAAFVQLAAGRHQFCGRQEDGAALCWTPPSNLTPAAAGSTAARPLLRPAAAEKFQQIAVGNDFFCGLLDNGAVRCGYSSDGVGIVPEGQFTEIAAGGQHTCALDAAGSAVCWGRYANADDGNDGRAAPPPDASFVAIAAAGAHSCGLTVDDRLLCWGQNPDGRADPQPGPFTQLAMGVNNTCALRPDGTVFCQGDDSAGQSSPPQTRFAQIALGPEYGCGVTDAGALECWGAGWAESRLPAGPFTAVSAGRHTVCGLRPAGYAECWGQVPTPLPYYLAPVITPAPGLTAPELEAGYVWFPVDMFSWPDGRFAVVDRSGAIVLFAAGAAPHTVLDIKDRVNGERGELGMLSAALDPEFDQFPFLYVYYTYIDEDAESGRVATARLARFPISADAVALEQDELTILEIPQMDPHHVGGTVKFGPDQMLYLGIGDDYNEDLAEDLSVLYGKIIRINVLAASEEEPYWIPDDNPFAAQADARPEIWAYGLRNPWRMSFDHQGRLWVGDVGWFSREELSIAAAGAHLGWPVFEGDVCHRRRWDNNRCILWPEFTAPMYQYDHSGGRCAITGALANTRYGDSVFASDLCSGQVWVLTHRAAGDWYVQELASTDYPIIALAADANGDVYVLTSGDGDIYRLDLTE